MADRLPAGCNIADVLTGRVASGRLLPLEFGVLSTAKWLQSVCTSYVTQHMGVFGELPHADIFTREKVTYMQLGRAGQVSTTLMCVGVVEYYFPVLDGFIKVRRPSVWLRLYW